MSTTWEQWFEENKGFLSKIYTYLSKFLTQKLEHFWQYGNHHSKEFKKYNMKFLDTLIK